MERYLALDLSSKTGWAAWDGVSARPSLGTKHLVGWQYQAGDMLELYRRWLGSMLKEHTPTHAFIEAWIIPQHGGGKDTANQIMLNGFTQWALRQWGAKVYLIASSSWHKTWLGSGRGKSAEFKAKAMRRLDLLGWEYPDDNAADAVGILDHGINVLRGRTPAWRDLELFTMGEASCLPKS